MFKFATRTRSNSQADRSTQHVIVVGMPRHKKRRVEADADISELLHIGGISVSGLKTILERLACPVDMSTLRRANREVFNLHCVVEPLATTDGHPFAWQYLAPDSWMVALLDRKPHLNTLFAEAWRRRPATAERPWSLVLGFDEFVPGNKLQVDNRTAASHPSCLPVLLQELADARCSP